MERIRAYFKIPILDFVSYFACCCCSHGLALPHEVSFVLDDFGLDNDGLLFLGFRGFELGLCNHVIIISDNGGGEWLENVDGSVGFLLMR